MFSRNPHFIKTSTNHVQKACVHIGCLIISSTYPYHSDNQLMSTDRTPDLSIEGVKNMSRIGFRMMTIKTLIWNLLILLLWKKEQKTLLGLLRIVTLSIIVKISYRVSNLNSFFSEFDHMRAQRLLRNVFKKDCLELGHCIRNERI